MLKKINWDDVPIEQVTPMMQRRLIYGEKVMIARMKFKDGLLLNGNLIDYKIPTTKDTPHISTNIIDFILDSIYR